jgi:hypothetical protein
MSVTIPPGAEVFGRIRADFRARRGPFRYSVVMPHELVAAYDVRNLKTSQATWSLRQLGSQEKITRGKPRVRFFVVDPSLMDAHPGEARSQFRRERGIPDA